MASRPECIQPKTGRMHAASVVGGLLILLVTQGPLQAETLKSIMKNMAETTRSAKASLQSTDPATFDEILQAYASESKSSLALFPGGSAKDKDLRARFSKFAMTVDGAHRSGGSPADVKVAFGKIVGECRSCHSVYK